MEIIESFARSSLRKAVRELGIHSQLGHVIEALDTGELDNCDLDVIMVAINSCEDVQQRQQIIERNSKKKLGYFFELWLLPDIACKTDKRTKTLRRWLYKISLEGVGQPA